MEKVISLIPNDEQVTVAKKELEAAGFAKNRVNVLFGPAEVWQRLGGHHKVRVVFKRAAIGASFGLIVGTLYGALAGFLNCQFMYCSVETGILYGTLILLYWVAGGAFLGTLVGLDSLERDLYSYVEGVRRGEALFVVETPAERADTAVQILRQAHGTVIHEEEAR